MKNILFKLVAFSIFLIGSTATYAGHPCIDNKTCTQDEFFMQAGWVSYELQDKLINKLLLKPSTERSSEITSLKHCLLMISFELAENVFRDPNKKQLKAIVDRKEYINKTNKFKDNTALLKQIYPKSCVNVDLEFEDYSKLIEDVLYRGRPLTDLDEVRISPEKFSEQHVRFIGNGKFILNNFYFSKGNDDLNPISVDLSAINSEEKLKLAKACGYSGKSCSVDLVGRVLKERSAISILADQIWKY